VATEYNIKKANHRQRMEMLDRLQQHQVRTKKDRHKQEMSEMRNRHQVEKAELQHNQKGQLENLKQKNDTFVQQERLNHRSRLDKQQLQAQKDYQRAASERARENARLRQEAQLEKERNIQLRDQARRATMEKKQTTDRQLEEMDQETRFRLQQKQAQMQEREQSLQKSHNHEVQSIEQRGQERISDRRRKYQKREREQVKQHHETLERHQDKFLGVKERQHNYYHKKLDEDEAFFQEQIQQQREEYTRRYQDNEKFNQASFENQDNRLAEEMFKLKKQHITTANFYNERKDDPFYSLVDFGAEFREGEAFYEVTAQIPEHEMDNVRVHIQPNKITLHATRAHEQEFAKDNEKIGSNIAQTIRQEFAMAKPADYEKAVKSYKDGTLTIVVPKKGYYQFGMS
jgi:HSP20 family molecular chaperone IbpA